MIVFQLLTISSHRKKKVFNIIYFIFHTSLQTISYSQKKSRTFFVSQSKKFHNSYYSTSSISNLMPLIARLLGIRNT